MLRLEVRSDAEAFAARVEELAGLQLSPDSKDPNLLARAAVALHHAYGAFESAPARIAKVFDTEPSGANWHRSLLETMAMEVPGIRPAVVGGQTLPAMRDLLACRRLLLLGRACHQDTFGAMWVAHNLLPPAHSGSGTRHPNAPNGHGR
jgi:hypothetical protein